MLIQSRKCEIMIRGLQAVMVIFTVLAFLKGIWISLDIDESYAVAIGYRMARGDMPVRDMWEPHQFSGFLAALFIAPYIWLRGTTEYLVVYLRIIGVLIHTGMGLALYRRLKAEAGSFFAFCLMILHLNFLPKWVQLPEFELMHYWCLLGIFLVLHTYFSGEGSGHFLPFAGGCLFLGSMLCYPTMILVYPLYMLALWVLERRCHDAKGIKAWRSGVFFTLGAFIAGGVISCVLFSCMSFEELKRYLSYIMMDTSHNVYTMGEKWALYGGQMLKQAQNYLWDLLAAAGIAVVFGSICRFFGKRSGCEADRKHFLAENLLPAVTAVLLLAALPAQVRALWGFLLQDQNQFYLQERYIAILLPAVVLGISCRRETAVWFYLCIVPGLASVAAVLFVTNMDTNAAYTKAFVGVLGSFLIFCQYGSRVVKEVSWKKLLAILRYAAGGMTLAGLLVCRLVLIRVSGCLPVTVRAPLERMESGPEKGIYVLKDRAQVWNDNYAELEKYIDREDKVLYIGAESLVYVQMEAFPATPSTQGTVVYNEMFLRYYEEHPEYAPDVIVYDKTFGENPVYALSFGFSLQDSTLFQWIEENYRDSQRIETDYMILLKKQGQNGEA